jgi:hypothetical protein
VAELCYSIGLPVMWLGQKSFTTPNLSVRLSSTENPTCCVSFDFVLSRHKNGQHFLLKTVLVGRSSLCLGELSFVGMLMTVEKSKTGRKKSHPGIKIVQTYYASGNAKKSVP